jgi:hypothetical protein
MRRTIFAMTAGAILAIPFSAQAQSTEMMRSTMMSVGAGAMHYDLEGGSGWGPLVNARWSIPFGTAFRAELGGSAAWARQTFDGTNQSHTIDSTEGDRGLIVAAPEVMLQMGLGTAGIAPYVGVGGGIFLDRADRQDGSTLGPKFSPSAAIGVRAMMANQLGLVAEARGRTVGTDFDRRTAELSLGLSWSLKPTTHVF